MSIPSIPEKEKIQNIFFEEDKKLKSFKAELASINAEKLLLEHLIKAFQKIGLPC